MNTQAIDALFVHAFKRSGAFFVKGKGMYLVDADKKKYLDFGSGIAVNALGHAHPALIKAIAEQSQKLLHVSNLYFCKPQIALAKKILAKSFGEKIFFCNSGTEANEAAIKFARKQASLVSKTKYHVLSFTDGFHGRTYGALAATAQIKFHEGFGPMPAGFHYSPFNDVLAAKKILKSQEFAAIIVEPVQGESGVHRVSQEFISFLRDYATKNKIALIFDEIQCGMGRTGTLWHYEQLGVVPDMMTLAKPLGGGLPLGAVVCTAKSVAAIEPGDHGTTFGGNPLACALGETVLDIVSKKSFLKDVKSKGNYLAGKLAALAATYPIIAQVRASGLLVGVELKTDPLPLVAALMKNGLITIKAGHNTIRFIPPLIAAWDDIEKAVEIFEKTIATVG